jgi:hypothetical protein
MSKSSPSKASVNVSSATATYGAGTDDWRRVSRNYRLVYGAENSVSHGVFNGSEAGPGDRQRFKDVLRQSVKPKR